MFSFNLLPQLYQRRTMRWIVLRHLHHALLWCTGSAAVLALVLLGTDWTIQRSLNQENARLQQILSQPLLNQVSTNVHSINERITVLRFVQQQHRTTVPLITALFNLLPDDVTLNSVDINYADERISLSGIARDRTTLKAVQESFQSSTLFTIEQFPFDEFAQADAIPFDMTVTMHSNDFQLEDLPL